MLQKNHDLHFTNRAGRTYSRQWRQLCLNAVIPLLVGIGWQQSALAFEFTPLIDDLPYGASGGLTFAPKGHYVYGTFLLGGIYSKGEVFQVKLPPKGEVGWSISDVKTVANFNGRNGEYPFSGVIVDSVGNIYGTASQGGGKNQNGLVFQITHENGKKVRKILKTFGDPADGVYPFPKLLLDPAGNIYGVTRYGGQGGAGVVFQLAPPVAGQTEWGFQTLVDFDVANGASPEAGLVMGNNGKLYGTTLGGGLHKSGTVFELTPPLAGQTAWGFQTLVDFDGSNGSHPLSELTWGADGRLYGTTTSDGENGGGTVFQLTPPAAGEDVWNFSTIKAFRGAQWEGPTGGLTAAADGSLYGTTVQEGKYNAGRVFKLTPPAVGKTVWKFQTIVDFDGSNGRNPEASLTWGPDGNLYGTTFWGGKLGLGTFFKITP
ncbi:choice-of-anchor tandem repeat GloVer-containing protein [Methylovulum miyakonense]|uniref:choice-of-anchor tandem repeat GloVer-containing protein n=1 Tax=Methylovulum miyakonense TaxID=645578 RepID=UPI0003671EDE|nr:choice-of-anchor tandem repeat GloVer-containing protein [Methylovulum miyakonense]